MVANTLFVSKLLRNLADLKVRHDGISSKKHGIWICICKLANKFKAFLKPHESKGELTIP